MITPAGLGIREFVFVFLAESLASPGNMAFLAVFARVWMMVIDLLLFLSVLFLNSKERND